MPSSPFVIQWAPRAAAFAGPNPRALDLAMGQGRHVDALARAGFRVFGVDRSLDAVRAAMARPAAATGRVRGWCADATTWRFPARWFDVVLVTRFLERGLFPAIREAVVPGGLVMYETFTRHQLAHGRGPTSPHHLLEPGELPRLLEGFEILHSVEQLEPDALATVVARRPR
jgi:tellurite methyltransferase